MTNEPQRTSAGRLSVLNEGKHIYTQNILICYALNVPQNVCDCISSGRPDDAVHDPIALHVTQSV